MILYALTGGAGCGKSTASAIFASFQNWRIIDADRICAELYADSESLLTKEVAEHFGSSVLNGDGTVNKKILADIVFNDGEALAQLNRIAHARVYESVNIEREKLEKENIRFAILDAPLLYESKWDNKAEAVIVVWTDKKNQYERLLKRGWDINEIERRLAVQMTADEKLKKADYGLINTGTIDDLREQCVALAAKLAAQN